MAPQKAFIVYRGHPHGVRLGLTDTVMLVVGFSREHALGAMEWYELVDPPWILDEVTAASELGSAVLGRRNGLYLLGLHSDGQRRIYHYDIITNRPVLVTDTD